MRISDWSSDVCSSDLLGAGQHLAGQEAGEERDAEIDQHRLGHRPEADVDDAALEPEERRQDGEEEPGIDADKQDLEDRVEGDQDRKSVVEGKSVSVRGELGGRRNIKKKKEKEQ